MASKAAVLRAPTSLAALLEPLGVAAGEDDVGALGACAPGGLQADAGAAADHDDGLPEQLRLALGRSDVVIASSSAAMAVRADRLARAAISARSAFSAAT